jgi:hypothetical protein
MFVALGCSKLTSSNDSSSKDSKSSEAWVSDNAVEFTASDYVKIFDSDLKEGMAARAKYDGQFIKVKGRVTGMEFSENGASLALDKKISLPADDPRPFMRILPGQVATFTGKCGKFGVEKWKWTGTDGSPDLPVFTAEQYSKNLKDDINKYNFQWLILTGNIVKIENEKVYLTLGFLAPGIVDAPVKCFFTPKNAAQKERNGTFKVGQSIVVVGKGLGHGLTDCETLAAVPAALVDRIPTSSGPPPESWEVASNAPEWKIDPNVLAKMGAETSFRIYRFRAAQGLVYQEALSTAKKEDVQRIFVWTPEQNSGTSLSVEINRAGYGYQPGPVDDRFNSLVIQYTKMLKPQGEPKRTAREEGRINGLPFHRVYLSGTDDKGMPFSVAFYICKDGDHDIFIECLARNPDLDATLRLLEGTALSFTK